jgi:hypothetical protein
MRSNTLIIGIIFLFGILNVNFQCGKEFDGVIPENEFEFKETVSISPYRLDYNVGDTIWLTVNIPDKKLFDEKTNTRVFFDSASFTSVAQVDLLYNNPFLTNGPFASFIFPTGVSANFINGGAQTSTYISYGCAPSSDYHLRLGIVMVKKGVFGLSFYNPSIQKCLTDHYRNSTLNFTFDVNDTHRQFYQQLDFLAIGKKQDDFALERLAKKMMVVVNVR